MDKILINESLALRSFLPYLYAEVDFPRGVFAMTLMTSKRT